MFSIFVNEDKDHMWYCNLWSMRMLREVMRQADIFSYEDLTSELIILPPKFSALYNIHFEYNQEILQRKSFLNHKVPIAKFCSPLGWMLHTIETETISTKLDQYLSSVKEIQVPSTLKQELQVLSTEEYHTVYDWHSFCRYTSDFNYTLTIS